MPRHEERGWVGHRVPNAACRPDARPRPRTQERRQGIGRQAHRLNTKERSLFREPVRHLTQSRSRRPRIGTSSTHQHCLRAMNATLSKQFEGFAECCLELARSAETTERRARFIQMAHEYRLATLLTSEEPSSGPKGRRLLPAAESPLLIAAEAPASRAQTRPQPRLFARSAAPRHPGFKAQMFDADKQNRDLSNRDQGGNAEGPDT